jgi:uncharacterized membrane protein YhaH (DUF805 family)
MLGPSNVESVNFSQAVRSGFRKHATFEGRATRSEFWYWILFVSVILGALAIPVHRVGIVANFNQFFINVPSEVLYLVFALFLVIPTVAISTRRLHDLNMSGWWQLVIAVPFFGILLWLSLMSSSSGMNVFRRRRTPVQKRRQGLAYMVLGGVSTAGILIVNVFHHFRSLAITSVPMGIAGAGLILVLSGPRHRHPPADSLRP